MKTAGEIFRKLKEAKFRHWLVIYKKLSRRSPGNCKFNFNHELIRDGKPIYLGLCLLHQESLDLENKIYPHLIDICHSDSDCSNCNAFIHRYTRDDIKNLFDQELKTKQIKEKKYPDICALEWVLEKYSEGYSPISWLQATFFKLKVFFLRIKLYERN